MRITALATVALFALAVSDAKAIFVSEVVSANQAGSSIRASNANPANALGSPSAPSYSMGNGGTLVVKFGLGEVLTGSGDSSADLKIHENGPVRENVFVEVSNDGINFFSVGGATVANGGLVDLDAFGFDATDQFAYVRLTDDPNQGQTTVPGTAGADILAVEALSFAPAAIEPPVDPGNGNEIPEPATLALMGVGAAAMLRRRRNKTDEA